MKPNNIEIYQTTNGETQISVKFEQESVWLTQMQMAELFGRDKSVISRHIKNIFEEEELDRNSVVAFFATTATDGKTYQVEYFNLDVIISVGYRVKSLQGTKFRIWATQRLREYLLQGYSINQKRLEELGKLIQIIENTALQTDEAQGLLSILSQYTKSFILLNKYDSNNLEFYPPKKNITYEISYKEACLAVEKLKKQLIEKGEATELFGNQKDKSFEGILGNILQTFGGEYLYGSVEEQAAHLLYFIIKNHPFTDGNKRIGALLFVWFLQKNKHLLKADGQHKINENALVALALLVAQSSPSEKELIVKLICNLIEN
ncbi:MAG: virulence protein RhuM/Fic/DOC family protein [Capnocytophaga sp.]|nr:virulence protein RhuM/Fic/DOC family protein [Capnocytophaga sp.]